MESKSLNLMAAISQLSDAVTKLLSVLNVAETPPPGALSVSPPAGGPLPDRVDQLTHQLTRMATGVNEATGVADNLIRALGID